MRVKLYLLALILNAAIAGWVTYELGRMVGPWLIAPRDPVFLVFTTCVAGGTFALLSLILMVLLGLRLVKKGGALGLVERSELANEV